MPLHSPRRLSSLDFKRVRVPQLRLCKSNIPESECSFSSSLCHPAFAWSWAESRAWRVEDPTRGTVRAPAYPAPERIVRRQAYTSVDASVTDRHKSVLHVLMSAPRRPFLCALASMSKAGSGLYSLQSQTSVPRCLAGTKAQVGACPASPCLVQRLLYALCALVVAFSFNGRVCYPLRLR